KAIGFWQQILNGYNLATIAGLYSEARSPPVGGGPWYNTGENSVNSFAAQALRLKAGVISPTFATQYRFHVLQVLDRRGEEVNVRHILIRIQPTPASLERTKARLDSISNLIAEKKIDFHTAASIYSDDNFTKYNGGVVTSENRSTLIPVN